MSVMNKFNKLKTIKDYKSFDYDKTVDSIDKEITETSSKLYDLMYDLQRLGSGVNFKRFVGTKGHQDPKFLLDYLNEDLEVKEMRYKEIKKKLMTETFNRFHDELWYQHYQSVPLIPSNIKESQTSRFEPLIMKEVMEEHFWKRHGYEVPKITLRHHFEYLKSTISIKLFNIKYKIKTFLKMLVPNLPKKVEVK